MKPWEIYEEFEANNDRLQDVDYVASVLRPHCRLLRYGWRGTRIRIVQHPQEFASFLVLMGQRHVRSYLEIGVSTGGSWMAADSYLRAAVPGYRGSVGCDMRPGTRLREFGGYRDRFRTVEFRHLHSKNLHLNGERFDAVFIDARHLHRHVMRDFNRVKGNASLVGFHDIVLKGATVDQAWRKIRETGRSWEFVDQVGPPEARCGIGVVEVASGA